MPQADIQASSPISAFTVQINLKLHANPTRLDILAGRFAPGDYIPLTLDSMELSSPELVLERLCRINGALIKFI